MNNIPELKPGDIFLSRNPMALGKIINLSQRIWSTDDESEYSHAGIMITQNLTLESLLKVKSQNIFESYKCDRVLIARYCHMSPGRFDIGMDAINKHRGQWYPFWRLALMIVPPLGKYINFGRVVCSELVCKFLHGAGLDIKWKGKNPDNIHDMAKNWDGWEIIFEGILK